MIKAEIALKIYIFDFFSSHRFAELPRRGEPKVSLSTRSNDGYIRPSFFVLKFFYFKREKKTYFNRLR